MRPEVTTGQRVRAALRPWRPALAIDVSGGMSYDDLRPALLDVEGALSEFGPTQVRVAAFDMRVLAVAEIPSLGLAEVAETFARQVRGGGTDFRPVFRWAHGNDADVLFVVTDGAGAYPEGGPRPRAIWLLVGPQQYKHVPFGMVIPYPVRPAEVAA